MGYLPSSSANANNPPPRPSWGQILFTPLGCLVRSPLLFGLLVALVFLSVSAITNGLPWQISPDFQSWTIDSGFDTVQDSAGQTWKIRYEMTKTSTFTGLVRHASPIREANFPLLSHDILVTSGDFSNPDIVRTSVSNHRFAWYSPDTRFPDGSINLLHTLPENEEIFRQLSQVKKGQQVIITGREILDIRLLSEDGLTRTSWADSGCNTLLVTAVEIQK